MADNIEFLFLNEVAERCRVPVSTVRHWVAAAKLASVRPGRRRLVRRPDLDDFLRRGYRSASREETIADPRQATLPLAANEAPPLARLTPSQPTTLRR